MNALEQFSLAGKIAIVTGSTRGIGRALAEGLASAGATVVVNGRTAEATEKAAAEIAASADGKTLAVPADVGQPAEIERLFQTTVDRFGRLDILVNNAGISPYYKRAEHVTEADWDQVIAVNLKAVFLCCQAAGKIMMPQKSGRIINISSVGGRVALPRLIVYCAAKGGVEQITRVLAVEWAQYNILVSSLAPTFVETDMTEGLRTNPRIYENLLRQAPLGRLVRPEELVGAAIYLASDASTYHTGQTLYVDGGWMAL